MTPSIVVTAFMRLINEHDAEKLTELMTEDHLFVDGLGQSVKGRIAMLGAWQGYFAFCPDYRITHDVLFEQENRVAVFGHAGGTIAANGALPVENKWRIPAAWLAVVEGQQIKEWRVYADNKPVYDIFARQRRGAAAG